MSPIKIEYLTVDQAKVRGKQHILKEAEILRKELQKSRRHEKEYA